jgi:predicted HTH transcriptional regulator
MRDSPFAEKVETNLINSNNATIAKLQTQFAQMSFDEKPLRFALIADSHGNYRDLEKTVKFINQRAVDFTIHLGERLRRIKRKKAFPATGWFGLGSSCSDVIPANNSYVALL